ncbi:MAG: MucR family transcriptional regulator [Rhodospirillales bacterium]|nr:MAG: MucR family transcriptional regulator [Rhodospirillales bacterium]
MKTKKETFLQGLAEVGLRAAIGSTERVLGAMRTTYRAVTGREAPARVAETPTGLKPAVPVELSVAPDYIVCLEDGKRFKMLKGHLRAAYGLSPEEYRAKWGLPADYPMVAPSYRAKRARMAKDMGLGHMRGRPASSKAQDSKKAA